MYYEINGNILPQVRLVDRAVLEPPYIHKTRQADEYILYVMTGGTLHLTENGHRYDLAEGDVILLDPDYVHQGRKASNCEYFYIHFRHPQIRRRREDAGFRERCIRNRGKALQEDNGSYLRYQDSWLNFPKIVSLKTGKSYLKVVHLLQEAMESNCNQLEDYKVSCACRVMEAMVEIAREAVSCAALNQSGALAQSGRKVHGLLNYLNAHYREPLSGDQIEELFSCNFDYLNRVFKKTIGKTIFVYLTELRIQHACQLLSSTPMKVAAVGYRVGFQDECYFSKVFKKCTGMTPGQYEKMTNIRKRTYEKEAAGQEKPV